MLLIGGSPAYGGIASLSMRTAAADRVTRQAYDTLARNYARLVPDMSLKAVLDRAVLRAFAEMLTEDSEAVVADVGCGAGRVTKYLHDTALRIVGLDLAPGMASIAQTSHPKLPLRGRAQQRCPALEAARTGLRRS